MTLGARASKQRRLAALLAVNCWVGIMPASAQSGVAVSQAGQRQKREDVAPNIEPLDRIESRIPNRVQSRVRNRIDRFYDPQANAASPYVVAARQDQSTGRVRR